MTAKLAIVKRLLRDIVLIMGVCVYHVKIFCKFYIIYFLSSVLSCFFPVIDFKY